MNIPLFSCASARSKAPQGIRLGDMAIRFISLYNSFLALNETKPNFSGITYTIQSVP